MCCFSPTCGKAKINKILQISQYICSDEGLRWSKPTPFSLMISKIDSLDLVWERSLNKIRIFWKLMNNPLTKSGWIKKAAIISLYSVLIVINLSIILPEMRSFGIGILRDFRQDGIWRSARFARSGNFADYIEFLRQEIPEDATVIIPPEEVSNWILSDTPSMQFFLAPRKLINCTVVECGAWFVGIDNTYILIMGLHKFPGETILEQEKNISMHNDTWGVYGPELRHGSSVLVSESYGSLKRMIDYFYQISFIVLILLMGYYSAVLLLPDFPAWSKLGFGFGLVMGFYSIIGYLIIYLEWYTSIKVVFYGLTVLILAILLYFHLTGRIPLRSIAELVHKDNLSDYILALLILMGCVNVFIAVGSGFYETDSYVLWGSKAMGIIMEGMNGTLTWGTNTTVYPPHIPVSLALLIDAFGFALPIAKAIFPLYYLSMLLITYESMNTRFNRLYSGLSMMVFATIPLISRHARIAYGNLPLTYFIVGGVILFSMAISTKESTSHRRLMVISGVFMALAIWTRPEGVFLVCGVLLIWFIYLLMTNQFQVRNFSRLVIPSLLVFLFWKLPSNTLNFNTPLIGFSFSNFISSFSGGDLYFQNLLAIFKYLIQQLFDFNSWGVIGITLIAAVIIYLIRQKISTKEHVIFMLSSLPVFLVVCFMYLILSFSGTREIDWWLRGGFNRLIMPGISVLWLAISERINSLATAAEVKER